MARKQFDASIKDIVEAHALDWARLLGAPTVRSVRIVDAEVSTVSAAADEAMLIDDGSGTDWILHPEFVSGRDLSLPKNIWWYNCVLHHWHQCLVKSVVLLLRRAADGSDLNGRYELKFPHEPEAYLRFRYRVVRLWELSADELLHGGIGTLPLATLTDDAKSALPDVVAEIDKRLTKEVSPDEASKLRAATTVLMGLRHPRDLIQRVLEGVMKMNWNKVYEDSSVVQEFMKRADREGEERGQRLGEERGQRIGALVHARNQLLRLGQAKLGAPDATMQSTIESMADLDRLDALLERLLIVGSWADLLSQT